MRRPGSALLLAASLAAAWPAWAWEPDARAQQVLARGGRYVDVRPDGPGASGLVRAAIDVAAPPKVVFQVLADCRLAPRMAPRLESCLVLERDPAGRWDVREHVSRAGLIPSLRSVFRSDFDPPRSITFQALGGDLPRFEGAWRVVELPAGAGSRVYYESRVTLPFRTPGPWARMTLRRDVVRALAALRRESLARAGQRG